MRLGMKMKMLCIGIVSQSQTLLTREAGVSSSCNLDFDIINTDSALSSDRTSVGD